MGVLYIDGTAIGIRIKNIKISWRPQEVSAIRNENLPTRDLNIIRAGVALTYIVTFHPAKTLSDFLQAYNIFTQIEPFHTFRVPYKNKFITFEGYIPAFDATLEFWDGEDSDKNRYAIPSIELIPKKLMTLEE